MVFLPCGMSALGMPTQQSWTGYTQEVLICKGPSAGKVSGQRHTLAILHIMNAISVFIVVGPRYARCAQSTAVSTMHYAH